MDPDGRCYAVLVASRRRHLQLTLAPAPLRGFQYRRRSSASARGSSARNHCRSVLLTHASTSSRWCWSAETSSWTSSAVISPTCTCVQKLRPTKHTMPPRSEAAATGKKASKPQKQAKSGERSINPIPNFGLFTIARIRLWTSGASVTPPPLAASNPTHTS